MKIIFSVFAAGFCVAMGAYQARRLQQRKQAVEGLISALSQMDMQMQYALLPLEAVLRRVQGALATLFCAMADAVAEGMTASEAYTHAAQTTRTGCFAALGAQERHILEEFAASLGRSDRDTQRANTRLAIERLRPLLGEAGESALAKGRMYRSLGLLCGAAVAILLI